jgi:hypothetical protein
MELEGWTMAKATSRSRRSPAPRDRFPTNAVASQRVDQVAAFWCVADVLEAEIVDQSVSDPAVPCHS